MTKEVLPDLENEALSSAEAVEQLTQLFEESVITLEDAKVIRPMPGRLTRAAWPVDRYIPLGQHPQSSRDPSGEDYQADQEDRKTNGFLHDAIVRYENDDHRVTYLSLSYVMPDNKDDPHAFDRDYAVWRVYLSGKVQENGHRRMVIDSYTLFGTALGDKLKEIKTRHTIFGSNGKKISQNDEAIKHDMKTEYMELWTGLYVRNGEFGMPELATNRTHLVLGRDEFLSPEQQQDVVDLAGLFAMAVQGGINWRRDSDNDPH